MPFSSSTVVASYQAATSAVAKQKGRVTACGVGLVNGRKSYAERDPSMVALAKEIKGRGGRVSLRAIAAELEAGGHVTPSGKRYSASAIASMLGKGLSRYSVKISTDTVFALFKSHWTPPRPSKAQADAEKVLELLARDQRGSPRPIR